MDSLFDFGLGNDRLDVTQLFDFSSLIDDDLFSSVVDDYLRLDYRDGSGGYQSVLALYNFSDTLTSYRDGSRYFVGFEVGSRSFSVSEVSEPTVFWLMGLGLVGLVMIPKRRVMFNQLRLSA